jgi:hypothetical protein
VLELYFSWIRLVFPQAANEKNPQSAIRNPQSAIRNPQSKVSP